MLTTTAAVVSVLLPGILSGPSSRQARRTRRFVFVSCLVLPQPASSAVRSKLTGIRDRESREAQCPLLDRAQGPLGWDREDSF